MTVGTKERVDEDELARRKLVPKHSAAIITIDYSDDHRRWAMAAMFCVTLSLSTGGLGPTGASVDSAKAYYGLPGATFNAVYYLSYVDFVIGMIVGHVILRAYGLRVLLCVGSGTMTAGYAMQMFYKYSFWTVIAGGMLVDGCRAFMWLTVPLFVARWFTAKLKSLVYGMIFLIASVIALLLLLAVRLTIQNETEYGSNYMWFLVAFLTSAAGVFVCIMLFFEEQPERPPGPQAAEDEHVDDSWVNPKWPRQNYGLLIIVIVVYILSVGPTWATSSLLLAIMNNRNYSNDDITTVALVFVVCALPALLLVGVIIYRTREYAYIVLATLILTASIFTVFINVLDYHTWFIVVTAFLSLFTGAYSMTFMECAIELAHPLPERFVSMTMFLWAQVSGAGCTLLASFDGTFTVAMWLFCGIYWASSFTLLAGVIALTPKYQRQTMERVVKGINTHAKRYTSSLGTPQTGVRSGNSVRTSPSSVPMTRVDY